ncbi:hypothetical protein [Paenibacillus sp. N3.4]|uniref:hypothetical protein n=1 Tax=Paenibacillus sp. N3.4 TaxID=2603222 RepID=UPI0011C81CB5|nr:hypothetical protein [Paenibacillus sp. N3.4]TXK83597.1 hypothetical protein FU659_12700 [Paenibacillus sp. N3.4]
MNMKISFRWLKLALAVVLLFGSGLPTVLAQTQNINGIAATVEDETGRNLNEAQVELYEYRNVSYNGREDESYYNSTRTYVTSLKNGEFFIPNAYLLKGNMYDLVVKGKSLSSNRDIVYHYTFKGGDTSVLNFTKNQLKELTFTHHQTGTTGDLVILAKNAFNFSTGGNYNSAYSYPYFNVKFDNANKATVLLASNVEAEAYASLNNYESQKSYAFMTVVTPLATSGQTFNMDNDLVKVTYPAGYSDGFVNVRTPSLQAQYTAKEMFVSKGFKGGVSFGVRDGDWAYTFYRDGITFDQDMLLQLDKNFQGSPFAYRSSVYPSQEMYNYFDANYKDRYGNVLQYVYKINFQSAFSTNTALLVNSVDASGKQELIPLPGTGQGTDVQAATVSTTAGAESLFEYDLNDNAGKFVKKIQTDSLYYIPLGNVAVGTYNLKLVKQTIPNTSLQLKLEHSIQIQDTYFNGPNQNKIQIEIPQDYKLSYIDTASLWKEDENNSYQMYVNQEGSSIFIDSQIITLDDKYVLLVALNLMDRDGRQISYLVKQKYTGRQLLDMQSIPVQQNLVKTEITTKGSKVQNIAQGLIKITSNDLKAKFTWRIQFTNGFNESPKAYLLSESGNYDIALVGGDNEGNGYNYSKKVEIPKQQVFAVDFQNLNNQLVSVELNNNGTIVPFTGFNIYNSDYQYAVSAGGFYNQKFNRIYTTPGTFNFNFLVEQTTKANETPWLYMMESGYRTVQAATVFLFNGVLENPQFGEINQYNYDAGNKASSVSVANVNAGTGGGGTGGGGQVVLNGTHLQTSVLVKSGDLKLVNAFVMRENGYQARSITYEKALPYEGVFDQFNYVEGTLTLTDAAGKAIYIGSVQSLNYMYANLKDVYGNYQLTFNYPIGPKEALTVSKQLTIGQDPNTPPGKPKLEAAYAGKGIKLTWEAASGASYYDVYAAEQGQPLVKIKGNVTGTSYDYTDAKDGKNYDLKVIAVNSKGLTTESNVVMFEVPDLGVSQLNIGIAGIQSSAGFLKIGSNLPIELIGSTGDGISAK